METSIEVATKDVERFRGLIKRGRPGDLAYVVLLGLDTFELPALLALVEKGFSWKTLERFTRNSGLTIEDVADMAAIPKRTLARRKISGRLAPDESDRLLRAARIFSRALTVWDGDAGAARHFFTRANRALGGATPLQYARTELGATEVDHLIGRIEHGIFS
jgi:putative toxin-antitoxin system antitoxin component (TIGR02293 family)